MIKLMNRRGRRITKALENNRLGKMIFLFEQVASTNDVLKEKARHGAPEGCLVLAEAQTRGRGRMGRRWLSLPGRGVYLSVLLRPKWPASDAPFVSTLAGAAVARALERLGLKDITLKWPNDIQARGKKIAGVLVESRVSRQRLDFIVVGIGINVLYTADELALVTETPATSCRLEGVNPTCDDVVIQVLNELAACYYQVQQGDRVGIMDEWAKRRLAQS